MNREFIVCVLDIVIVLITTGTILGSLMGIPRFYNWGGASGGMAVNTAVCLIVLAIGQATMAVVIFNGAAHKGKIFPADRRANMTAAQRKRREKERDK